MQLPLVGLADGSAESLNQKRSNQPLVATGLSVADRRKRDAKRMRDWRRNNPDKVKAKYGPEYWRDYYKKHRAKRLAGVLKSQRKHIEKHRARAIAYARKNREKMRAYRREYFRVRKLKDPLFTLRIRLKDRLNKALRRRGTQRACRTMEMVGCTILELKAHIEKQFTAGMTWKLFTRGKIHLDHIRPFTAFDLSDPEQQKAAMHWTNLRPSWPRPNLQKHSHWNGRCWRHKDHVLKLTS